MNRTFYCRDMNLYREAQRCAQVQDITLSRFIERALRREVAAHADREEYNAIRNNVGRPTLACGCSLLRHSPTCPESKFE